MIPRIQAALGGVCRCCRRAPPAVEAEPAETLLTPRRADEGLLSQYYDVLPYLLGAGSFGVVKKGTRKSDGLEVAIKFISKVGKNVYHG